jgi:hypothetical protein
MGRSAWDYDLLKESPTSLAMEEAVRRATKKVMPEILGDMTTRDSPVTVVAVVNKNGSVECMRAQEGHPFRMSPCIKAAQHWKFRPYTAKGHSVPLITNLTFHFRHHTGVSNRGK